MSRNSAFRIHEPTVIYQLFDQELVAIHSSTGTYHSLQGIGKEVFLMLAGGGISIRDVATALGSKYEAPLERIEGDVERFFGELRQGGLIVPHSASTNSAASVLEPASMRQPYVPPAIESFSDLNDLFLIDPVHDVSAAGWPATAPSANGSSLALVRCKLAGPDVIYERFDEEIVAMNVQKPVYYSLTGSAEDIFDLLQHGPTSFEIKAALEKKYVLRQPDLDNALRDFLDQLTGAGLIETEMLDDAPEPRELPLAHSPESGVPRPIFVPPTLQSFGDGAVHGDKPAFFAAGPDGPGSAILGCTFVLGSRDILFAGTGGDTIVLDRDKGLYYRLNAVSSEALRLFRQPCAANRVVAVLERAYQASGRELRAAVLNLLSNLVRMELVVPAGAAAAAPDLLPANPAAKTAFPGFDVTVHRDLEELMKPFNPFPAPAPKPQGSQQKIFLKLLADSFAEAVEAAPVTERNYSIAGRTVRVRALGSQCALLHNAFDHLTELAGKPTELTIHAWSGALPMRPLLASHISRLREEWTAMCGPRGEFHGFHSVEVMAIYHPGPNILSVLDVESGAAYYLTPDDRPLPFWELSSPFRHIFHRAFDAWGLQYTHAGAAGVGERGALFAGKGGSGKSTTALLCAAAGLRYAGDDYCLTDAAGRVFSLYNTAKLKGAGDLARVPALRDKSFNPDSFERGGSGKGAYSLTDVWPGTLAASLDVRAILIPSVTHEKDTRVEPCRSIDALHALLPSTIAQLPGAGEVDCRRLSELAECAPAYILHLGQDLEQIPQKVRQVLE